MRPPLLDPLFASLKSLPGVGPKVEKLFARLLDRNEAAPRVVDLLLHLPTGTVDRRARPKLRDVEPGSVATLAVTIDRHRAPPPGRSRAPYQIYASDETGDVVLTFFHGRKDHLETLLPVGELRYVSGVTALYDGMLQMVHPDRIVSEAELHKLPAVEPVYPLTEGLSINLVRKVAEAALGKLPALPEWQDDAWRKRNGFPSFADALAALHRPERAGGCAAGRPRLDAARLRRISGGPARARPRARAPAQPARPRLVERGPAACAHRQGAAVSRSRPRRSARSTTS